MKLTRLTPLLAKVLGAAAVLALLSGQFLGTDGVHGGGTSSAFGAAIDLATAEVAGVLPIANIDVGVSLIDGTRAFTGAVTTSGDLAVNGDDVTCDSVTCSLFNATATTINIGDGATTINFNGSSASTGVTMTNGGVTGATSTWVTAIDSQGVIRNTAGVNVEIDEGAIRGSAALAITTQNNGDVTLAPAGTGDVVLTPGTVGRVELNTVTLTALAATLCDTDAEVGHMYRVSSNVAADIVICVCGKVAGVFAFFPLSAAGDCIP